MLDINIWDEISKDGSTYAYVETDGGLSDEIQQEMLLSVKLYIDENIPELTTGIEWVDHLELHPNLKSSPYAAMLPKRWELKLSPLNWETLGLLVDALNADKKVTELNGYPVTYISES
ncbi:MULTISPECIES: hypothetical protein [Vibrio]|uniref:hypothetical protein n=1 Tax=Vibrio TaxID=662 RepID=UPI00187F3FC5|nr:hypothetical protein [Vibrio sp. OPT46]MBE8572725.1 hypothetical protein [Vibrio sp. OPT46]